MTALGMEPSSFGVAKLYADFLKLLIVDESEDCSVRKRVKELGVECISMNTRVDHKSDNTLAREILTLL